MIDGMRFRLEVRLMALKENPEEDEVRHQIDEELTLELKDGGYVVLKDVPHLCGGQMLRVRGRGSSQFTAVLDWLTVLNRSMAYQPEWRRREQFANACAEAEERKGELLEIHPDRGFQRVIEDFGLPGQLATAFHSALHNIVYRSLGEAHQRPKLPVDDLGPLLKVLGATEFLLKGTRMGIVWMGPGKPIGIKPT
ncbi:MAG: hypothetical protein COV10_03260 [Candidatus Vogelbacteria bacterium CG10_big_fil_rev_8_21_14_0_10_51_16]|uniref:Uncharacterized protein n=1 Tax=Candidatus Vogelbacteria bacterium CG10_big_fil_rev_8_21_14_0_10_51_16 TaxID=1975045 RepID=A0A2H0RE75_9BACT|nr:MAG: hypothetical protein COV10_03260 [Candidatus Vogelbacteria bacterium CG10_big_fil_rev_8_21_14_0_10_51_16]